MAGGHPVKFLFRTVPEGDLNMALSADGDALDSLRKDRLVKGGKPHRIRAERLELLLGDGLGCAVSAFLFCHAAIPVNDGPCMIGRIFGSVSAGAVYKAASVARAFDYSGKAGDVQRLVCPGSGRSAPRHFLLDKIEGPPIDDGFVGVRDKKLRQLAVVFLTLAVYRVRDVLLLKDQVACIGDVGQNAFQAGVLKAAAVDGADAFRVQPVPFPGGTSRQGSPDKCGARWRLPREQRPVCRPASDTQECGIARLEYPVPCACERPT